ncbi:hypothetical protein [Magnetospira sp. QH-2]|uniref:hypothetical protein n=1 Tax=Magnetospira sp. (strain QH-2) TaxID=1288970 RepID=UPI0003E80B9E|nr:hypothetical protein [Magnetospira sp. QH-2]CCQ72776.1 conserved protein of unknown function [Magnetospira sp. QH-2]
MKFKLSSTKRPSAVERRKKNPRDIVTDGIDVQIESIQAAEKGEVFTVTRHRYFDVTEDGVTKKVKKEIQSKPKQWWWQDGDLFLTEIRYGSSAVVQLEEGMPSIECGKSLKDVIKTLEEIKKAVLVGEFDDRIAVARQQASRKKTA